MSFYIKPPRGTISLNKLDEFASRRLELLLKVHLSKGDRIKLHDIVNDTVVVSNSHCLIGGTQKDDISHFILRLILSADDEASRFLLETEILLFTFRCSCMTQDELFHLLRSLNRLGQKNLCFSALNPELRCILKSLFEIKKQNSNSWKSVACSFFKSSDNSYFQVPFQTVFSLIAKRHVTLNNGVAFVPFAKLIDFLTETFSRLLNIGITQAKTCTYVDSRIHHISSMIMKRYKKCMYRTHSINQMFPSISHDEIDVRSESFPPCMLHLHTTLRERHRLNHHSRIQYTLFLKETGLPIHESLLFWRKEYSQATAASVGWGHHWKTDGHRYTYNIRHLYGLEGSRRNYRGHCCHSIQNQIMRPTDVGGCPFVHFDHINFHNFLQAQKIPSDTISMLQELSRHGKYNKACEYVLKCKIGTDSVFQKDICTPKNESIEVVNKSKKSGCVHSYTDDTTVETKYFKTNLPNVETRNMTTLDDESNNITINLPQAEVGDAIDNFKPKLSNLVDNTSMMTSDDDGDMYSCNHVDCPSQKDRKSMFYMSKESIRNEIDFVVEKPLDYYTSYENMMAHFR